MTSIVLLHVRITGRFILCFSEHWIFASGVHRTFDPPTLLARWPDADRRSWLVFITRDLDLDRATVAASWAEMT
jgi:G3E family GTPase